MYSRNDNVQMLWAPKKMSPKITKKRKILYFLISWQQIKQDYRPSTLHCNLYEAFQVKTDVPKFYLDVTLNIHE